MQINLIFVDELNIWAKLLKTNKPCLGKYLTFGWGLNLENSQIIASN